MNENEGGAMGNGAPKMDPEIKAEWLERLRSGEYEQGHNKLRRGDRYCCLGVLGCIFVDRGEAEWRIETPVDVRRLAEPVYNLVPQGEPASSNDAVLPAVLASRVGLDPNGQLDHGYSAPSSGYNEPLFSLTACNDEGIPFSEIADIIEKEF